MITTQLLRPESIVVVGASNNVHKPGGAILKNLINGGYRGELRAVNQGKGSTGSSRLCGREWSAGHRSGGVGCACLDVS